LRLRWRKGGRRSGEGTRDKGPSGVARISLTDERWGWWWGRGRAVSERRRGVSQQRRRWGRGVPKRRRRWRAVPEWLGSVVQERWRAVVLELAAVVRELGTVQERLKLTILWNRWHRLELNILEQTRLSGSILERTRLKLRLRRSHGHGQEGGEKGDGGLKSKQMHEININI
jgi:hypothetical protein